VIGVLSKDSESRAVQEFFQLFKTPWEFCVPRKHYDLVIVTREEIPQDLRASSLVLYNSQATGFDDEFGLMRTSRRRSGWVEWQGIEFPIYGDVAAFQSVGQPLITLRQTPDEVGGLLLGSERPTIRIGIDLFYEVAILLAQGQPAENARFATLDTHISLLRAIMVSMGIPFVEVPPVPAGYDFMACLTHDVDFVHIRDHKWDRTMWGFLYRATVGSLLKALAGRLPPARCLQNWAAASFLPFVHLGLLDDFWLEFDRYMEIERELGSTFFFLPFKNVAGRLGPTPAPRCRAGKYDLAEIKEQVLDLVNNGCEVGLHGIDAWQDLQSAQSEQSRIREVTGQSDVGVRMHWLYWNEDSPETLEDAGFTYDSTFGYNDAIGFRAGTTQPFCPLGAERLLELPLNIQDSAMFYSDRMMLSETEALNACRDLIHSMSSLGGVLTVNWHTRSLSPERLWGDFYARLLKEIQTRRVWFGTAHEIVEWFRKRRALRFDSVEFGDAGVRVALSGLDRGPKSSFALRIHHPQVTPGESGIPLCIQAHADNQCTGAEVVEIPYSRLTRPCTSDPALSSVV
jgi:hypothetical protein